MRCPVCSHEDTKVVDTRITADGIGVRRRRECEECEYRFSTIEAIEILDLAVRKSGGRREPYSREKVESGLRKALEKRPCDAEQFRSLVVGIERDLQKLKSDEVESKQVGEIVMEHLRRFDTVAYIRFASVYRSFADAQTFHDELAKLMTSRTDSTSRKR